MTVANSGTPTTAKTPNTYTDNSLSVTLATTTDGDVNFIWLVANASGTNTNPVASLSGWTLLDSASDGTGPSVWGYLYWKKYTSGDPSSVTINFTPNVQAVAVCWGRTGVDNTGPAYGSTVGIQTPSSTAKSTDTFTSTGGWIESGFGDRNAGTYTSYADTLVASDSLAGNSSAFVQSSEADVTAGSQTRTATGPNTSAGVDFIMELVPGASATDAPAEVTSATGTASDAVVLGDYASAVLALGPEYYFRLDETSGTTAYDRSGNARNGTYGTGSGSGYVLNSTSLLGTDTANPAVVFASGANVTRTNGSWAYPGNTLSVAALARATTLGGTHTILSNYTSGDFGNSRFTLRVDGTTLKLYIFSGGSFYQAGSFTLSTSTTYHVVATYDGSTARIYVDGVKEDETSLTVTPNSGAASGHVIGTLNGTENWEGTLDEVAFFSGVLSDSDVSSLYSASIIATTADAGNASGTGAANDATVVADSNAPADEATATGTAYDATALTGVIGAAEVAEATGAAYGTTHAVAFAAEAAAATGSAVDPTVAAGDVEPGATVTSATPNTNTNTSLTVDLPTAVTGDVICIDLTGFSPGTDVDPTVATPDGWTVIGTPVLDTPGTAVTWQGSYYRRVEDADPTTVDFTWTNAGQMVAVATAYGNVDEVSPILTSNLEGKGSTDSSYAVSLTIAANGLIRSGFANRSGHTYTGMSDSLRGSVTNTSASSLAVQDTGVGVAAGTYAKTATGSGNTSIGAEFAYALKFGLASVSTTATPTVASGAGAANAATAPPDRIGGSDNGNDAAPSITLSSQIQQGQVILVHLMCNNSDVLTEAPEELSQIDFTSVGTSNASGHVYTMVADDATAGSTLTFTLSATRAWSLTYLALPNIDQNEPVNSLTVEGDNVAATTTFTMPSVLTGATAHVVQLIGVKADGVSITDLAPPTDYTVRAEVGSVHTYGCAAAIADYDGSPVGVDTYGGDDWTTDANGVTSIRYVIALNPADSTRAGDGRGEANDATMAVTANAEVASATGSTPFDPTGSTVSTTMIGDSPVTGLGVASDGSAQSAIYTTVTPGVAGASALTGEALAALTCRASGLTATGAAYNPTIGLGEYTLALAGVATATVESPAIAFGYRVVLSTQVRVDRLFTISVGFTAWRKEGVWYRGHAPSERTLTGADLVLRGGYDNVVDYDLAQELLAAGFEIEPV